MGATNRPYELDDAVLRYVYLEINAVDIRGGAFPFLFVSCFVLHSAVSVTVKKTKLRYFRKPRKNDIEVF